MHWLNKHARFRNRLSPYVDGALSSSEIATLKAHLGTCEACRAELDELRATVAATRDLPQVDAPRSFALTPQMLERRAVVPAPSAPPLALGMRLASAGVAVFLAVVVIGDLSGVGGGSDGTREAADQSAAEFRSMAESDADTDVGKEEAGAALPAPNSTGSAQEYDLQSPADGATSAAANDSAACPPAAAGATTGGTSSGGGAGPASTGGAGGGVGGAGGPVSSPGATPIPQPPATPTPGLRAEAASGCEEQPLAGAVAPTTSAPEPEQAGDSAAETASADGALEAQDDGDVSTLRVIEIVLAGSLIALVAAIAVELALRRRRAA